MPIEKNLKNTIEPVNTNSEETKKPSFSLKNWITNHRITTRNNIFSTPLKVTTIVTAIPFALAFCQFLTHNSNSSLNSNIFFQKNLPIFSNFKPKLNSETLQYISPLYNGLNSSQQNFLFGQPYFLANLKKSKTKTFFSRNNDDNFNGIASNFYLLPSGNFLSQVQHSLVDLDELPSYIQGLKQKSHILTEPLVTLNVQTNQGSKILNSLPDSENNVFSSKPLTHRSKPTQTKKLIFLNQKQTKNFSLEANTENLIHSSIAQKTGKKQSVFPNQLSLVKVKKKPFFQETFSEIILLKNPFYSNQMQFYNTVDEVSNELETVFLEKNISLPSLLEKELLDSADLKINSHPLGSNLFDSKIEIELEKDFLDQDFEKETQLEELFLQPFLDQNQNLNDELVIETILRNFEKERIGTDLTGFRLMSGYKYPDTTTSNLDWYYKKNSFGRKKKKIFTVLKPEISQNYSFSAKYKLIVQKVPSFLVQTQNLTLKSTVENKLLYTSPALVLDSEKALDWRLRQRKGKPTLRSWFHRYVSPFNSLTSIPKNFLGLTLEGKTLDFSEFTDKSFLKDTYVQSGQLEGWAFSLPKVEQSFAPTQLSFHISTQNSLDKTRFVRGIELSLSKGENSKKQFQPIILLQYPSFKIYSKKTETFEGYSSLFNLGITANPDYKFSIEKLNHQNFTTKYMSGQYLKKPSVLSKKSSLNSFKVENWEGLNSMFWLVIIQISFAIWIFQVLKSLADNYGRELLAYLLNLVASLGVLDEGVKQQIEILMGERNKGFRVVLQSQKTFTDIVGIEKFLPEISEVVWFLRNSGRNFQLSKTVPHGVLLTGPPGTGKTLLVQAIAGEAKVPVVVLSGSSLIEPGESASTKLEMVFEEAKQVAPCIVFIDEIDTLGEKRSGIVHHSPMDKDELIQSITSFESLPVESPLDRLERVREKEQDDIKTQYSGQPNLQQLGLLTRLLIELDGIRGRDGVIVIGATNRPEVLDPALLRPGRFDKIIQVGLPTEEKRVEILKFYGQSLGYKSDIPWNYLGERTAGFSAADLATLMNESAIKAILTQSNHTIQTIEHGIDRLTTAESEKYTLGKTKARNSKILSVTSKLSILQVAYYQAGKILLSYFLENHPKSVFASLWPRRPTLRSLQISTNLENTAFNFARLCELNDRLIGCYAGRAAEFLFLEKFSTRRSVHSSTFGLEDLFFAQQLIYSMLEKSLFYSKKSYLQKTITLLPNVNTREFRNVSEKLNLYGEVLETIEIPPMQKTLELDTSSLESKNKEENETLQEQVYYSVPWWQQETSSELEFRYKNFPNWSRIYLSNPELNDRNPEWLPPDEFYHTSTGLKNVTTAVKNLTKKQPQPSSSQNTEETEKYPPQKVNFPWNDVTNLTRDYPVHSLVLQSFNKALVILNQNRELLDRLVIELIYQEVLRKPEIEVLVKDFQKIQGSKEDNVVFDPLEKEKQVHFVEFSWGPNSRKALPHWIDFGEFSSQLKKSEDKKTT